MAFHLSKRRARQPLKVLCNGKVLPSRRLTDEEMEKVNTGGRSQEHLMLLESPKPGDDLTYVWDMRGREVWVHWPHEDGGHFIMPIERNPG
jgi:hypothetical protein